MINKDQLNQKSNQISFTLYPAHSRVGRGNLVLRHTVPHFPPNFGGITPEYQKIIKIQVERGPKKGKEGYDQIGSTLN